MGIDQTISPNQLLVKNDALSVVDFADTNKNDNAVTFSGVGTVSQVGGSVKGYKEGDEVAFISKSQDDYKGQSIVSEDFVVNKPREVDSISLAAAFADLLLAHTLTRRVYVLQEKRIVLIHNCATGVGYFLAQMARAAGAIVIGTVTADTQKGFASEYGCHKIINLNNGNWAEELLKITNNYACHVVYDCYGKESFANSLRCLMKMGIIASYNMPEADVKVLDFSIAAKNSNYITFSSIWDYKAIREEFLLSALDVIELIKQGQIRVSVRGKYSFDQLVAAISQKKAADVTGSVAVNFI